MHVVDQNFFSIISLHSMRKRESVETVIGQDSQVMSMVKFGQFNLM